MTLLICYYSIFNTIFYDEIRTQPKKAKRKTFSSIKKKIRTRRRNSFMWLRSTYQNIAMRKKNERKTKKPWKQSNMFSFLIWKGYSLVSDVGWWFFFFRCCWRRLKKFEIERVLPDFTRKQQDSKGERNETERLPWRI